MSTYTAVWLRPRHTSGWRCEGATISLPAATWNSYESTLGCSTNRKHSSWTTGGCVAQWTENTVHEQKVGVWLNEQKTQFMNNRWVCGSMNKKHSLWTTGGCVAQWTENTVYEQHVGVAQWTKTQFMNNKWMCGSMNRKHSSWTTVGWLAQWTENTVHEQQVGGWLNEQKTVHEQQSGCVAQQTENTVHEQKVGVWVNVIISMALQANHGILTLKLVEICPLRMGIGGFWQWNEWDGDSDSQN